jgi:hypothetical protein
VHARAKTPIPLQRTQAFPAATVPFSRLRLTRWTHNPHRVPCGAGLRCVAGQVDVRRALSDLRPLLPQDLPLDPRTIHETVLQVALRGRKPVYLKLDGKVEAGLLLGDVPFEVTLDLPTR